MTITEEQFEHYMAQVNEIVLAEIQIDVIVAEAIPIYTRKKLNPKSGRADCPNTVRDKQHFREIMRMKLGAAKTEEQRKEVIEHYKSVWGE